jgi:5-methylcytosine-specific restriction endonuclease McrA
MWFDTFPNVGGRRVSVAFQSFSKKVVLDLVSRGAAQVKQPGTYSDRDWGVGEDDTVKMNRPLPKRHFGRPLLELYERGGSAKFLTMYLPNVINPRSAPPREVVLKAARYLAAVIRATVGVAYRGDAARDYSKIENRQRVQRHLVRERSVVLPRLAKERDHYTCRICRFNFSDRYGSVGRSFAEAHHTVPLSSVHAKKATVLADLITVCANCHRMLHRGKGISVSGLKAAMTGWWPE